jgi:hypothetical protein
MGPVGHVSAGPDWFGFFRTSSAWLVLSRAWTFLAVKIAVNGGQGCDLNEKDVNHVRSMRTPPRARKTTKEILFSTMPAA